MSQREAIYASLQSTQEKHSLLEVEKLLLPWRITWVDGRDDFGRDGFIQIVDNVPRIAHAVVAPLTCAIQVKSTIKSFTNIDGIELETRHLKLWSEPNACPLLVALWSKVDSECRIRTARAIALDLDTVKPTWRKQGSVTVHFAPETTVTASSSDLAQLRRAVLDESDASGGQSTFHSACRRVLLTELYYGTITTSQTLSLKGKGPPLQLTIGTGWKSGDLDPADVLAPCRLVNALILFEELWIPLHFLPFTVAALGYANFERLIKTRRLVFFESLSYLGYLRQESAINGELGTFERQAKQESANELHSRITHLGKDIGAPTTLSELVLPHFRKVADSVYCKALAECRKDLTHEYIRRLLRLSRNSSTREPFWNAVILNRLAQLNMSMSLAIDQRLDVVEFESGMGRIASEKWYHRLHFSRMFPSARAFDEALRMSGAPDLGLLHSVLGMDECVSLSMSDEAQAFRDWFWKNAAAMVASGADATPLVDGSLHKYFRLDSAAFGLTARFKLRFFQKINHSYVLGTTGRPMTLGVAARGDHGDDRLLQQSRIHFASRMATIASHLGQIPMPYKPCPCGSGEKFKHCCGMRP